MMGLQEELEEYHRRAPEFMQRKQDRSSDGITARSELSHETLPEDWQERILAYILQVGAENIAQVYLVQEQLTEDFARSAFVLRYREDSSEDQCARIYDQVFRLLDDWPVDWEFSLYNFEPAMEKPLKRVDDSCIYNAQK